MSVGQELCKAMQRINTACMKQLNQALPAATQTICIHMQILQPGVLRYL